MAEDRDYGLLVSFPDESASFVNGFEAGGLWRDMEHGDRAEIEATTHIENREVIRRMADNLGWTIAHAESGTEGWDFTTLTKTGAARSTPNSHGLRVIQGSLPNREPR